MSRIKRTALVVTSSITAMVIVGCSGGTLDWRNAQVNNGKIYAGDANTPFSGKVTNIPLGSLYGGQPGYQKIIGQAGAIMTVLYGSSVLCDAEVEDGRPDGEVVCKQPQSDTVTVKGHFDKGVMDGSFTMYDKSGKNAVLETSYKDGQPDGELKRYAPGTGKLVSQQTLTNGVVDGEYKEWDPSTGNLLVDATYVRGVLNGDVVKKDADGNTMMKGTFSNGKFTGIESFHQSYNTIPGPDFVIVKGNKQYEDGVLKNGPEVDAANIFASDVQHCVETKSNQAWASTNHRPTEAETPPLIQACKQEVNAAKATAEQTVAVAQPTGSAEDRTAFPTESNACTLEWQNAFHKANGPDALINYDQAWEFVDNCRAGKHPQ
ncbi:toxin-antitoxin system YwqK family antitoxin [Burkholderia diffusa]|nr:toxin-antitoxin system YwqK family antitoxin [Burkholderia diffusa]KAB0662782.1 toxin-antitoxin system YwqK family antitoxin [Burkholderia diffusa]MBM2653893.1 toxin-antitoxin system YwqK family antitoxin [Burkholderia diffusa]